MNLKSALKLLNSTPLLIILAYLPDFFYALSRIWLDEIPAFFLYFPLKAFFYAGIYGALIELISQEEILVKAKNILHNAKQFFFLYLALSCLTLLVSMLLQTIFTHSPASSTVNTAACLEIAVIFLMALWMTKRKYPLDTSHSLRQPVSVSEISVLALLYTVHMITQLFLSDPGYISLAPFLGLAAHYIQLLMFIVIASAIMGRSPSIRERFSRKDEIYMINPIHAGILAGVVSRFYPFHPPLFVVLKALSPGKYKFREFNKVIWNDRFFQPGKLVAITCFTSNSALAYRIAKGFKEKGSKVVMGGPHVSCFPEEALEYCDSVVDGEAEGVWENIVKDYEQGTLQRIYHGSASEEANAKVHQELLQSPPYVIKDFIETTRGCKFKCDFCSIPSLTGGRLKTKPSFEIVELLKKIQPRYKHVNLLDNNIYSDPAYAKELFTALKPLNISWSSFCTIDIAKNAEMLKLAKDSGCTMLYIGYEVTGNPSEQYPGGKLAMAKKYKEFTGKIKAAGIKVRANFIFGLEEDSWKNLLDIWRFSLNILPTLSLISCLTPLPGTQLYRNIASQNRITNLNWYYYNGFNLVFRHKNLNPVTVSRLFSPLINFLFMLTASQIGLSMSFALVICFFILTR